MKLTEKLERDFNLAGFCERTKETYYRSIVDCKKYFQKPLITLTEEDLKNYFSDLVKSRKSRSVLKHRFYALRFLFTKTFERDFPLTELPWGKEIRKLPIVLNLQEIKALLDAATTTKQRAIIAVTYSGGLRISETVNLKNSDIDSNRMMVRISQGKGRKDRYTLLSQMALGYLREYYTQYRPQNWLFQGKKDGSNITTKALQISFQKLKRLAGIQKKATFHSLRHSFATHLYENGVGLVHIQRLLGHASIKTTMVYIHLAKGSTDKLISPLDNLLK